MTDDAITLVLQLVSDSAAYLARLARVSVNLHADLVKELRATQFELALANLRLAEYEKCDTRAAPLDRRYHG